MPVLRSGVLAGYHSQAFSPILPGDYQRTSYPVAVFVWTLCNPTDQPLDLSLLLSWRNTTGWFTNTDASAEVHFRDDGSPEHNYCLLYTSPSPRDMRRSRMPSSA